MNEISAKTFLKGKFMCGPSFLVCARLTTCIRARTRAQLRGNITVRQCYTCVYVCVCMQCSNCQSGGGGSRFFVGGGVESRGRGVEIFFPHGVEKEVGGGQILSSIIEERGKLSIWCKSFTRNLFKRSSQCLPQQYLIIISSVGVIEIHVF